MPDSLIGVVPEPVVSALEARGRLLRAIEVQGILAERGQHRAPAIPDLLTAASAELTRRTVLHVDKDFDVFAAVTGQPMERLRLA